MSNCLATQDSWSMTIRQTVDENFDLFIGRLSLVPRPLFKNKNGKKRSGNETKADYVVPNFGLSEISGTKTSEIA